MRRSTKILLPLALLLAVLYCNLISPQAAVTIRVVRPQPVRLHHGTTFMANPQVIVGGAAVNVPMTTTGYAPDGTSTGALYFCCNHAGNPFGTAIPASGSSVTVGNYIFTNTGTTVTVGGNVYPVLSIQALTGAVPGTGFGLGQASGAGTPSPNQVYGLFDVVNSLGGGADTSAPTFANAGANGNLLTILWADADGAPIQGTTGLTLSASGGAVSIFSLNNTNWRTDAVLSRAIRAGELLSLSYTPGNFADSAATPNPVAAFSNQPVTNNTQGVFSMANPTTSQARVGCSGLTIFPRVPGAAYPFAGVPFKTVLQSIQNFDFTKTSKLAMEIGGETVHQINGYETDRIIKGKFSVMRHDYSAFSALLAGTLIVDAADGQGPETQYYAEGYTDRAPYFTIIALSANGDPTAQFVAPKAKFDGNLGQNWERDNPTKLDVDFTLFWDPQYIRQDGALGGIQEMVFNNGGSPVIHS